jgi:hypothetical protein
MNMDDIRLVKNDWIMLVELIEKKIFIGEANDWFEEFITMGITHETIHIVIDELEGLDVTDKFDNIFGYANPTILLLPESDTTFDSVQRARLEKEFWNEKGKRRRKCLDSSPKR